METTKASLRIRSSSFKALYTRNPKLSPKTIASFRFPGAKPPQMSVPMTLPRSQTQRYAILMAEGVMAMILITGKEVLGIASLTLILVLFIKRFISIEASCYWLWTALFLYSIRITAVLTRIYGYSWVSIYWAFHFSLVFVLIGYWKSLYSPEFLRLYKVEAMNREYRLMLVFPILSGIILGFATIERFGNWAAGYELAILLTINFGLVGCPVDLHMKAPQINIDSARKTLSMQQISLVMFIPAFGYVLQVFDQFLTSYHYFVSLGLMFWMPWMVIESIGIEQVCWWINKDPVSMFRAKCIRITFLLHVSGCIQCVFLYPYGQSFSPLHTPWDFICLSGFVHSIVFIGITRLFRVDAFKRSILERILLSLGLLCLSIFLGVPFLLYPSAVVSGYCLSRYFECRDRLYYVVFGLSITSEFIYFVYSSLWFVQFNFAVFSISVQIMCAVGVLMFMTSLFIPVFIHSGNTSKQAKGILGALYWMVYVGAEFIFVCQPTEQPDGNGRLYVIASGICGGYISLLGDSNGLIPRTASVFILSLALSKPIVLLTPDLTSLLASFILCMASISTFYMYAPHRWSKHTGGQRFIHEWGPMTLARAILHNCFVLLLNLIAQDYVWRVILGAVWGDSKVTIEVITAWCFTYSGIYGLATSIVYFSPVPSAFRFSSLMLLVGIVFMVSSVYDTESATKYKQLQFSRSRRWVSWFIFVLLIMVIACYPLTCKLKGSRRGRIGYAVVIGILSGAYFNCIFVPVNYFLYFGYTCSTTALSMVLIICCMPTKRMTKSLPQVYGVFLSILPLLASVQDIAFYHQNKVASTIGISKVLQSRLACFYALGNLMIAVFLKYRLQQQQEGYQHSYVFRATLSWHPTLCVIATLAAFVCGVIFQFLADMQWLAVMCPLVLLLLHEDELLLPNLNLVKQLALVYAMFTSIIVLQSFYALLSENLFFGMTDYLLSFFALSYTAKKNLELGVFLWMPNALNISDALASLPLNVAILFWSDMQRIQMLASTAIIGSTVKVLFVRKMQQRGKRII